MLISTDRAWRVKDSETGTTISVSSTPEIDYNDVVIETSDSRRCTFSIGVRSKLPDKKFRVNDPDNPTILLPLVGLKHVALFRNGTREENTAFVRYVLSALSMINRQLPISRNPFFYTDRFLYEQRDADFHFDIPPESEISKL